MEPPQTRSMQRMVGLRWLIEEWPGEVLGHYGDIHYYTKETAPRLQCLDEEGWHDVPTVRIGKQPNLLRSRRR